MTPYTYTILRYVHDPAAGEAVNVGVLFYAPDARYVCLLRDTRYGFLSRLFAGFNPEDYGRATGWLESAVERFGASLRQDQIKLFEVSKLPADAGALARQLVPDQGLTLQWGLTGAGLARRVEETAQAIYERLVTLQRPAETERRRRNDDDVWNAYREVLRRHDVTRALQPLTVETREFEIPFDHAFKNGNWQAVEPMTFDYLDASSIRDKALKWRGYGAALGESGKFSHLYLLLGKPSLDARWRDYALAKSCLRKMPIEVELIEEDGAEDFARFLAGYMREHGLLPSEPESDPEPVEPAKTEVR